MAYYTIYQDNRKNGTKLFYGRAVHPSTIKLDALAEKIEHNCSMTKGDCLNVLTELVTVMKDELQTGNKVCLDGFGTFGLAIVSKGAISEEDFDIQKAVRRVKTNFLAAGKKVNGSMTRTFSDDVKWQRLELAKESGD